MYYSSIANDVYSSSRGREKAVKPPWVQKREVRNTSNTHSAEHTRPSTHPPTQQPTDAPTYPPTMCYSDTAEYSSRCIDDTNRVAATLGFPCVYDYPPPRGASRPFPGRPPLAESFIGARSFARSSARVLSPASHRAAVWEGRGATPRPREAKWSSGVAAVFWV